MNLFINLKEHFKNDEIIINGGIKTTKILNIIY